MQWWQAVLTFGGVPMLLFACVWALVWLTTTPSTVPPGVAQPSSVPSGGLPPVAPEGEEMPPAAPDTRPGDAHDPVGDQ